MRRAAAIALLVCVGAGLAPAETFKRSRTSLPVGLNANALAVADLNGDGRPEIVVGETGRLGDLHEERPANDLLSLFVSTGEMEYERQPQLRAGFGAYDIVIANIDALQAPDIVVANFHATRNRDITLLRNLGDNLFEPLSFAQSDDDVRYRRMRDGEGSAIFSTPGLTALAIHDFDGDGYRDALACGWSSDVLCYFPGHIEDYFASSRTIAMAGGPRDLAIADFDGNGTADVAVALYSAGKIAVLSGQEDGSIERGFELPAHATLPVRILAEDVNADGNVDLIVGHAHAEDVITIFFGDGRMGFPVSQELHFGEKLRAIEFEIRDMAAADFNGDGLLDLSVAGHAAGEVVVLLQKRGTGLPLRFNRESYRFKDGAPRKLALGDVNEDGKTDIVVVVWKTDRIEFLLAR